MGRLISLCLLAVCLLANSALAQPQRLLILTTGFVAENKLKLLARLGEQGGLSVDYQYVEQWPGEVSLDSADFILIDTPRSEDQAAVERVLPAGMQDVKVPVVQIQRMTPQQPLRYWNLSAGQAARVQDYYLSGMADNRRAMLEYINACLRGSDLSAVPPPRPLPDGGIYHPQAGKLFETLDAYLNWWNSHQQADWQDRPVIAMETTSSYIADAQTAHLDAVAGAIEQRGGVPVLYYPRARTVSRTGSAPVNARPAPLAPDGFPNPQPAAPAAGEPLLQQGEQLVAHVLLVNTFLGGNTEARKAKYQQLGIPVLQVLHYRSGDAQDYLADQVGIEQFSLPFTLTNAEYIGIQDPVVLTAYQDGEMQAMPEQLDLLIDKAFRLAVLQRTDNRAKKLALLFWNHPPGETNQGASNLNVPRSLHRLTGELAAQGYQVPQLAEQVIIDAVASMLRPAYRTAQLPRLMATPLWDFLPLTDYQAWFATLPAQVQQQMNEHWGEAGEYGALVEHEGQRGFVIPRLQAGNLVILPQPGRGGSDPAAERDVFHDLKRPMHHYYAAVYLWIRQHYQADAIIHFGTHGTQEWHPGKERGLWAYDAPNLAVGDIPVLYPYIVDNIGEALHVKRRGRGVIISHQTPPFSPAGLADEFAELNTRLNEYRQLLEGPVRHSSRERLVRQVTGLNVHQDMGWDSAALVADFDAFADALEDYLETLGAAMQPLGLHTFGEDAAAEHSAMTLMLMLQEPLADALDIADMAAEFRQDYRALHDSRPYRFVYQYIVEGQPLPAGSSPARQAVVAEGRAALQNLQAGHETRALLSGLQAGWVDPSYGGDPVRNPDALPTGRNMYGFDPSRVPARSAYAAGVEALDDLLDSHQHSHGQTPTKLAFTLWSTETMRHLGMLEAQVLAALGVRPVWDRGGRVVDLEVISLEELGRPRIDVVVSLTGLYRDQFPAVIERLNQAVVLVAQQDEPPAMNPLRSSARQLEQSLLARGYAPQLARNMALTRVFGTESGDYGTGLPEVTLASDQWQADDTQLAELYLSRMSWGYGPDPSLWSHKPEPLGESPLNLYAEQLKGTQAAVFSRSSNLRGLLDTDHPFEYLGGISLAVQHLEGSAPQLYIANLRNPGKAQLQTAERFLATELRAVYQHPNWLKEMQAEGYAGTLQLLDTLNNFWGWQVMDERVVRDDQWETFHQVYINDQYDLSLREWFEQVNPAAMAQMVERMLEAIRMGYWEASDTTRQQLVERYQELAAEHDVHTANQAFKAYLAEQAAGYGMTLAALPAEPAGASAADAAAAPLQEVSGQQMTEVIPVSAGQPVRYWLGLLGALLLLGMIYQHMAQRRQCTHTGGGTHGVS